MLREISAGLAELIGTRGEVLLLTGSGIGRDGGGRRQHALPG